MVRSVLCIVAVSVLLVAASPAISLAGAPMDTVKSTVDKVIGVLNDKALKAPAREKDRRAKIMDSISTVFDFEEMAKRSLAQYWKERSAAQKKEFVDLFKDLLERSYINRIENYSGEKVVYEAEKMDGDNAVVKSKFITKRREEIPVEYRLLQENGKWYVYDVVIENVSLVNNYRVQFRKVISGSSYDDLLRKMKNKQESEAFIQTAPAAK